MRFLDVGPEPIQVTGYRGDGDRRPESDGGKARQSTVGAFYAATRRRQRPWLYSAACLGAPAVILATAVWVSTCVLDPKSIAAEPAPDTVAKLCNALDPPASLANASSAAALHFAISHLALLLAGAFAFVFAVQSMRNVLAIHLDQFRESAKPLWIALAGSLILGWGVYGLAVAGFEPLSDALFGVLRSSAQLTAGDAGAACFATARRLSLAFDAQAVWGVRLVAFASSALAAAAAAIAWRFEIHKIDGVWADTYVLRHKLKALLTLFVLGSLLLVASNIALSAYSDLGASVIEATQPQKSDTAKDRSADKAPADKSSEDFAKLATLRKALLNAVGALSSLTLVGMFLPAFAGLTGEIELAGKTHADADMRTDPTPKPEEILVVVDPVSAVAAEIAQRAPKPPENVVAGYKTVVEWKSAHGLALEFADVATAMAAAAAPLFSNGVFDVAKTIFGVP